jgi:GH15 family glucan-1,4-alpha-glucosidase
VLSGRDAHGYAPIADYAVLGDGRTVALVARDGSVDWWPVPAIDAPPIFAALLEPAGGGYFCLQPEGEATSERRYVRGTNVLQTTYSTGRGTAMVTDALNSGAAGRLPWTELVRQVECSAGEVALTWRMVPGDRFRQASPFVKAHHGVPVARVGDQMLAVVTDNAGVAEAGPDAVGGQVRLRSGQRALISLVATDNEPVYVPCPASVYDRLARTTASWKDWSSYLPPGGRWEHAVERSALALKTLLYEPSGAIAAAATTSLPERVGSDKNYDYRYAWVRDSSYTLDAFMSLGLHEEVHGAVSWILSALRMSRGRLHVFYTMDGRVPDGEAEIGVPGYQGSRPVRAGNSARGQTQLGVYGDFFDMMARYAAGGHVLDDNTSRLMSGLADECCSSWQQKDSGIWELPDLQHYTISKIGCWVALDRACRLAEAGQLPRRNIERWRHEAAAVRAWVDERCWSAGMGSYTFYAGSEKLDAAVLLAGRTGFAEGERLAGTIEAVVRHLSRGPAVYRYSGMDEEENAFVACSFWLVSAMAHNGQVERACELMDGSVAMANDLGLFSEQVSPTTGELFGNIPQGLSHVALINAAHAVERAEQRRAS